MQLKNARLLSALLGLFAAEWVSTAGPAHAGQWRFHPERCPDLVEDVRDRRESRRDERVDRGPLDRADRRESRRDERVTVCPKTAWVHHGKARHRSARPGAIAIYYDPYKRNYYHYGSDRTRILIAFK